MWNSLIASFVFDAADLVQEVLPDFGQALGDRRQGTALAGQRARGRIQAGQREHLRSLTKAA